MAEEFLDNELFGGYKGTKGGYETVVSKQQRVVRKERRAKESKFSKENVRECAFLYCYYFVILSLTKSNRLKL